MSIEQPSIEQLNNVDNEQRGRVSEKLKNFLRNLTPFSDANQEQENTAVETSEAKVTTEVLANSVDNEPEKTEVLE